MGAKERGRCLLEPKARAARTTSDRRGGHRAHRFDRPHVHPGAGERQAAHFEKTGT